MATFQPNHLISPALSLPGDLPLCDQSGMRIVYDGGMYYHFNPLYTTRDSTQECVYIAHGTQLVRIDPNTYLPIPGYHAKQCYARIGTLRLEKGERYHTVSGIPLVCTGKLDSEGNILMVSNGKSPLGEVFSYLPNGIINPAYCRYLRKLTYPLTQLDIRTPKD